MAEKPGELNNVDRLDPLARRTETGTDPFLERYSEAADTTDMETREMLDNTGDHPEETEQIKSQIEETRREMGETIDAIQERLSLSNISEQVSEQVTNAVETAKDTVYDATIGKVANFMRTTGDGITNSSVVRTARNNPFPLLLIGLGAGLLAYQSYSGGGRRSSYSGRNRYLTSGREQNWERRDNPKQGSLRATGAESRSGGMVDSVSGAASGAYDSVSNAASGAVETVSSTASSAYRSVSDTLGNAYSGAGDLAGRAYERAGEYGNKAYETYDYYLEENPLVVGAVAAALGAAVGFAIPTTQFEGRIMGETREHLLNKVGDAASQFVEKARNVAGEAGQTIKDEANRALNA